MTAAAPIPDDEIPSVAASAAGKAHGRSGHGAQSALDMLMQELLRRQHASQRENPDPEADGASWHR